MKKSRQSKAYCLAALLVVLVFTIFSAQASAELTAVANHDHIEVGFFYHGSTVTVRGISDPSTDLVIKMTSVEGHQALKEKGKVAGVLWMNVGTLNLENVPNLYFVNSTRKIEDILTREEMDKNVIGYEALGKHIEIKPLSDEGQKAKWFKEFLKFKESSKLYSVVDGKFSLTQGGGKQSYYTVSNWPYQAPPGMYTVTVYAVKNGKITETAQATVRVEQVGIVKSLAGLAKDNGALYGLLSIFAALGAGFGVGLVFRKGGGAH